MSSGLTTNFGPIVSLTTTKSNQSAPHLYLDSNTTFTAAGPSTLSGGVTLSGALTSTATVNLQSGVLLSRATSASLTSATLADGEFAIGSVSVTSMVLNFRSGATTYTIIADAGSVL